MQAKKYFFAVLFYSFGNGYYKLSTDIKITIFYVYLGSSDLNTCQDCILSVAVAVHDKFIPPRRFKKRSSIERDTEKEAFETESPILFFLLLQQYCSTATQCGHVVAVHPSSSLPASIIMQNQSPRVQRSFRYSIMRHQIILERKILSLLERIKRFSTFERSSNRSTDNL